MLTTFVIALREGLEASLIVGIIAAFLRRQGRSDALRSMWLGVALAIALCVAVAVVLRIVDNELPHRQQEGLETVVALVAVAMVTYMIVWMTEHARDLKGQLQDQAAGALAQGSAMALVAMAFLAVLREGFETSVFLLAAFNDATDPLAAGLGVVLGLVAAVALGFGIYRGGLRLNLSRFFRATGVVLVLVAAGLVASSLHTAAEAGWVVGGQGEALDLSAIVRPGTIWESLITGILGIHPEPTVIEVVGWLLYAIPMLAIVLVPDAVRPRVRATVAGAAVVAAPIVLLVGTLGGDRETSAAVASAGAGRTVNVAITNAGCEPATLKLASGPTTFVVTNKGASKVSEYEVMKGDRAVAEVENVTSGLTGRFSLTLQPGRYSLRCPGATNENAALTVTGARANAALAPSLQRGVDGYRAFLERETSSLVTGVQALRAALASGDLAAAQRAYAVARVPYERVEPVAESFGDLDPRIDARANDVPRSQWTGFHPIERRLWVQKTTKGTAKLADGLVSRLARAAAARAHGQARARPGRQRRQRAAGRGLQVEDHRRGGALLAHRPARFPGQRRGRPRGVRRDPPGARGQGPRAGDRDRAALRPGRRCAAPARARRRLRPLHRAAEAPGAPPQRRDRRARRAAVARAGQGAVGLDD